MKTKDDGMVRYVVMEQGYAITKPMTIPEIKARFGSIQQLESNGYRLVKV